MGQIKLTRGQLVELLVNKKCLLCNGDVILNIEFDKPSLLITFHTTCRKCNFYFKVSKPCESIELLEWAQFEIAKSTLEAKGYVSGWGTEINIITEGVKRK